jgi:hypothetical protein
LEKSQQNPLSVKASLDCDLRWKTTYTFFSNALAMNHPAPISIKAKARKNMFIHIGEGIGIGAANCLSLFEVIKVLHGTDSARDAG